MRRFDGKKAVVTGAASGIGKAVAIRLAEEGAAVACLDIQADAAAATAAAITDAGGTASAHVVDLLDTASIKGVIDAAAKGLGGIDVLCNIAGLGHFANDVDETIEGWGRVIGVNLTGTFFASAAALPYLLDGGGNIVNTASTAGTDAQPWSAAYSASKGGVIALTQTMAINHGRQGVRVNGIAPGGVDTPIAGQFIPPDGADLTLMERIMPFHRTVTTEGIAGAYAFLASGDAEFVNGVVFRVDDGAMA